MDEILYDEEISPNLDEKTIYIIQYPGYGYVQKAAVSFGTTIKQLDKIYALNEFEILHHCSTEQGSSGSPILKLENNKVIGIHNKKVTNLNFNKGIFLRYSINEFLKNKNIIKKNGNIKSTLNEYQQDIQSKMTLKRQRSNEALNTDSLSIQKYINPSKTGLKNLGNTSYLNAILQVLGSLKNFVLFFLIEKDEKFFTNNIKEHPLSFVTHRLFTHLFPYPEKEKPEIYVPSGFLRVLSSLNNTYNDTNSKNPNKLINLILNTLDEESNKAKFLKLPKT